MKTFIITLITTILSFLPSYAVKKKVDANPINVAHSIAEKTDSTKIASILEYYGYIRETPQDNYTIFTHPNGSEIRYTFSENEESYKYPRVQVFTKLSEKEKQLSLDQLKLKKTKNYYERQSTKFDRYLMQCHNGKKNSLIFFRVKNKELIN